MEKFSKELFQNPTKEYRGAPFWAWNGELDREVLQRQIDVLKEMGFGGFHIHSRIGLSTEYLGSEFMDCVRFCHDYGKEKDMLTWLYDEDKWPSGYGGGRVTEKKEFRARYLLFSPVCYPKGHLSRNRPAGSRLTEDGEAHLLERYQVRLREGRLEEYRRLCGGEMEGEGEIWYAYEVVGDPLPWFNNAPYVDTLNPEATRYFTSLVYEAYARCLGEEFSRTVPAIFTDEPQFTKQQTLKDGRIPQEAGIAYTSGMEQAFGEMYGYSFFDHLPEIFWERADGTFSQAKYHYHNFIAQRFADAYGGVLGKWCGEHHLMLTGHLMYEDSLERQTMCVGDAMRSYPHFQLPGIDILADKREYNTAKQAQSVSRQQGAPGVTSELYGVTNWDYDFRGHKLQGDWQAALGVTVRVPHLAWMYMGGESKRDYPAPIDAHSPWYQKYPLMEDHFARINTVLRRGKARVRVGVLHPIESYWLLYGPERQTLQRRREMDERFMQLTQWLLFGLVDFDFLSEGLLPDQQVEIREGSLFVGEMTYEAVVIPPLLTIRSSTLKILEDFQMSGGNIIMLGDTPSYVDGERASGAEFLEKAVCLGFEPYGLLRELEPYRDVEILSKNGLRTDSLIYQMREEEKDCWLFLAHGKPEERISDNPFQEAGEDQVEIRMRGHYRVWLLDTMTGEIVEIPSRWEGEFTWISCACYEQDSFLFHLEKIEMLDKWEKQEKTPGQTEIRRYEEQYLTDVTGYKREEPNVLLLDQARWRLDGGQWMPCEEILKIDDTVRGLCGYRRRTDSFPQPWLAKGEHTKEHLVELEFAVYAEEGLGQGDLAFEGDSDVRIWWKDREINWSPDQSYVDPTIHRISLGAICGGSQILRMQIPFGVHTNLEWCYLLGEFGVKLTGPKATLTKLPKKLGFGDYSVQGFPFYGGNMEYELEFDCQGGVAQVEIPLYAAALLEVRLDDREYVPLFLAPYRGHLGKVEAGHHTLHIRAYGNRSNQFGQLHNCNPKERYFGPKTWRTEGKDWCYEYQLKKNGVLTAPVLRIYEER
ncbi:MAG: hypothetical protein HFI33_09975 [Lachnospiraceae bacterium]|nr:hypothetical protein [Lachnospiraceae bacterium]